MVTLSQDSFCEGKAVEVLCYVLLYMYCLYGLYTVFLLMKMVRKMAKNLVKRFVEV